MTQRAFYVMISRAKHGVTIVTNSVDKATEKLAESTGAKTSSLEHQQKIQDQPGFINLNRARREYFKYEPDAVKFKAVAEHQFVKNSKLIKDVAVALFGNPVESTSTLLVFKTKFMFKEDFHSDYYYGDNLVTVNLAGEYTRLNNINEESYGASLYKLAQESGLFDTRDIAEQNKKLEQVQRLLKNSEPIHGTLAAKYLAQHREIDTTKIKLSENVRFMKRAYSSDTKDRPPALLVIGRNKDGTRAAQLTYLDPNTQNKNKALPVVKRSMGVLKGSFVELTTNKDAKDVFIAEGVETALSIALVQPEARVICSLGSSNLPHINLGKNKNIIICADNDGRQENGEPSSSMIFAEAAARALASKGNSVSIIMPDQSKTDFNDVLKVYGEKKLNQYIAPTITPGLNYKKIFEKLNTKIAHAQQKTLSAEKKIRGVYSNSKLALGKINEELDVKGSNVLSELKAIPEKFGELALPKDQAIKLLEKHASTLILNNRLLKIHTEKLGQLTKDIKKKCLAHFDTRGKNIRNLEQDLKKPIFHGLKMTDNRCDFVSVEKVTLKVAEQIVEWREKFSKEPSAEQRFEFFLRARYELEREPDIKKQLAKTYSVTNQDDRILLLDKLSRALSIDSMLANKDSLYYKPVSFSKVSSALKQGDAKISNLTDVLANKGIDNIAKAAFIARQRVNYEERNGTNLPTSQRKTLDSIGTYVSRGDDMLRKNGLSSIAASRIMHREGAQLALYQDKRASQLPVSESTVKRIQKTAGQFYKEPREVQGPVPAKQHANIRSSSTNKSAEIEM